MVCDCVTVVGLEKLARGHPRILGVQTLHFLSVVIVASQLIELDRFLESADLVIFLGKVTTWHVLFRLRGSIKAIMNELPQKHATPICLLDKSLGLKFNYL